MSFPKAGNISKLVDKRLGAEREVVARIEPFGREGRKTKGKAKFEVEGWETDTKVNITAPSTPQAKALDGSYAGFQPKPATEIILVSMKPLSEKTYVDQALKNGKGIVWFDDCRIPLKKNNERRYDLEKSGSKPIKKSENYNPTISFGQYDKRTKTSSHFDKGRFPANLIVSDNVLDDGKIKKTGDIKKHKRQNKHPFSFGTEVINQFAGDSGSFSRYFDLNSWAVSKGIKDTFPFLIIPKASGEEKNNGWLKNNHETVKPVKLMAYLITLTTREGDIILDPFMGSGSTLVAAVKTGRKAIGIDNDERACEIAANRFRQGCLDL